MSKLFYRGGGKRRWRSLGKYHRDVMKWALGLKPGDIFGSCTGFNHYVAKVEPWRAYLCDWGGYGSPKSWFLYEVELTDTMGDTHMCPGGGCATYPYTLDELSYYLNNEYNFEHLKEFDPDGYPKSFSAVVEDAVKNNKRLFDENGVVYEDILRKYRETRGY